MLIKKYFLFSLFIGLSLTYSMASQKSLLKNNTKKAFIEDSAIEYNHSKADMFYLEKIDGKIVYNSRAYTMDENYGRGLFMHIKLLDHNIPMKKVKLTIVGCTHYAAPILEDTNKVYKIRGEIEFTPKKNSHYIIKGLLKDDTSSVWVENYDTKEIVGNKIKIERSTNLDTINK